MLYYLAIRKIVLAMGLAKIWNLEIQKRSGPSVVTVTMASTGENVKIVSFYNWHKLSSNPVRSES